MLTHDFIPSHISVRAAPVNLTGRRFNMLVATAVVGKHKSKSLLWRCKCDCGAERDVPASKLVGGKTKSCGCENLRSKAQIARFAESASWNKGVQYQLKGDDDIYRSKKAWTDAVIKRFGNICQRCGWSEGRCDAHHKIPRSKGGLNTIANAEVLCPNCHRVHHDAER